MNVTAPHGASERTGDTAGAPPFHWKKGKEPAQAHMAEIARVAKIKKSRAVIPAVHDAAAAALTKYGAACRAYTDAATDEQREQASWDAVLASGEIGRLEQLVKKATQAAMAEWQTALEQLAEKPHAAPTAAQTMTIKTARPRTNRRQHTSTTSTRTTVTASAAGSSDSPSAGSSRSGSRPPSAEDDPAPPDRLKVSHTYVVDTAGSVVDGCTMLMGVAP